MLLSILYNLKMVNNPTILTVSTCTGSENICCDSVYLVQADSNYSTLFLTDKRILTSKTLKYWLSRLNGSMVRCHRTYCVKKDSIIYFNRQQSQLILSNGVSIPVSRNCRKSICAILRGKEMEKKDQIIQNSSLALSLQ